MSTPPSDQTGLLKEVLEAVKALTMNQTLLTSQVDAISGRVNVLSGLKEVRDAAEEESASKSSVKRIEPQALHESPSSDDIVPQSPSLPATEIGSLAGPSSPSTALEHLRKPSTAGGTSRIILTTYPSQSGINPLPMDWGHKDPQERGPVVVSRTQTTIRRRNAIGGELEPLHNSGARSNPSKLTVDRIPFITLLRLLVMRSQLTIARPDFTNTEPAANIGPFQQWADKKKIVSMDPLGHLAPWLFKDIIDKENVDIRPTIAITRAHMKLPELEESVRAGRLVPDGKVCLNDSGELAVTKFAVEPVWYLPGVAERFGIDEGTLRRALFEHTGGSYPELITRGDIKVFLPPIGGLTVYCFGDPAKMSDEKVRLALRVHDEASLLPHSLSSFRHLGCNGSDVFGSDICTCRPYLIYGIEEAVKEAQKGGSGVVIYFRKEGRALGEVTKYLVYNARKRGLDRASEYFKRTENIAGVKDMRFQALMPDILHWLGIKKIDRMLSMSNMKHDAIVGQGIPIHERVELPESWIPADSRVEIDAKITAGYFTTGHRMTEEELAAVKGRSWEEYVAISLSRTPPTLPPSFKARLRNQATRPHH
ncbi:related to bifunctional GTP cyclohydrolase II/3, 4-dihydroxy-2butanone-4-phosphate synthase [Rhynchosporium agropyri]|uniref:Related to bifunctional GTP cyclohydrolase II/3, 4-dihydroxy-2butanone-4-phosphate synthase n=1 Tax=Rhynchosporium agropyri TaxID=914238 RepID=A0A1E1JY82_9HELO|nr:related to bifunctional GTP cyclohydrolase II/3, 4-dihydroxy-2butanone-4-phosphate synthase [Rhynchosporium agropyri]